MSKTNKGASVKAPARVERFRQIAAALDQAKWMRSLLRVVDDAARAAADTPAFAGRDRVDGEKMAVELFQAIPSPLRREIESGHYRRMPRSDAFMAALNQQRRLKEKLPLAFERELFAMADRVRESHVPAAVAAVFKRLDDEIGLFAFASFAQQIKAWNAFRAMSAATSKRVMNGWTPPWVYPTDAQLHTANACAAGVGSFLVLESWAGDEPMAYRDFAFERTAASTMRVLIREASTKEQTLAALAAITEQVSKHWPEMIAEPIGGNRFGPFVAAAAQKKRPIIQAIQPPPWKAKGMKRLAG